MEQIELLGYCGVDCSVCSDFVSEKCPGCRQSIWPEGDACPPLSCCKEKAIRLCGECRQFPSEMMKEFYRESESHERAYRLMCSFQKAGHV